MTVSALDLAAEETAPVRKTGFRRRFARFARNRLALAGALCLLFLIVVAVLAPWIVPYPDDVADSLNFDAVLQAPTLEHPMGTDEVGRDVLTRVMAGARWSLSMAAIVLAIAVTIGVLASGILWSLWKTRNDKPEPAPLPAAQNAVSKA